MGGSSLAPWVKDGAVAFLQRLVLAGAQRLVVAFGDLMTGARSRRFMRLAQA